MKFKTASLLIAIASLASAAGKSHWVATWGPSPSPQLADEAQMATAKLKFDNQTLREIVHVSVGGNTLRIRLSNAYGKETLDIGAVHIALRAQGSGIVAGSDHALTFGGRATVSVPPDAPVLSDPVKLDVKDAADVAISIYVPKPSLGAGIHYSSQQTSYIASGDVTGAAALSGPDTIASWVFLTGVEVLAPESTGTVVAFGDSITDGAHSTVDANTRWPDFLAARLLARHGSKLAVVDAGIGGNRILHDASGQIRFGVNALARFDRDVLAQPGVKYVIILEGINDLGHPGSSAPVTQTVSAQDLIAGMQQLIERSHQKGIKIFGATICPFEGAAYFTPEKEVKRKAINEWIRTGKAFDGVVDFDKAVQDPTHPAKMAAAADSGDHLHPADAGYKAMGNAIDLSLFK
jgi:lysophospholipase L1-like esterase